LRFLGDPTGTKNDEGPTNKLVATSKKFSKKKLANRDSLFTHASHPSTTRAQTIRLPHHLQNNLIFYRTEYSQQA
jgi:hypothetical protein